MTADAEISGSVVERPSFDEMLEEYLEAADDVYAAAEIAPKERVFSAATDFVRYRVLAIRANGVETERPGETLDFVSEPWFAHVYQRCETWFRQRYGRAILHDDTSLSGVVLFRGVLLTIEFPTSHSKVEEPGKTAWIGFRTDVCADEQVLSWLRSDLQVAQFPEIERVELRDAISFVASSLLHIRVKLIGIERSSPAFGPAQNILPALDIAASKSVGTDIYEVNSSIWDLSYAVENAFKAVLRQAGIEPTKKHDLIRLFGQSPFVFPGIERERLKRLPRAAELPFLRSREKAAYSRAEWFLIYKDVLSLTQKAVNQLRGMNFSDAQFLIRKAPWLSD